MKHTIIEIAKRYQYFMYFFIKHYFFLVYLFGRFWWGVILVICSIVFIFKDTFSFNKYYRLTKSAMHKEAITETALMTVDMTDTLYCLFELYSAFPWRALLGSIYITSFFCK